MDRQFAAGGIVFREKDGKRRVLLIKDSYGHWIWPKGHIEKGESPEEAALREVSEETGLESLRILGSIGKQEYWFTLKGEKIFKTVYVFLMENAGDEKLRAQVSEIEKAEWFEPEEAVGKIEYEGSRGLLEKGLRMYGGEG